MHGRLDEAKEAARTSDRDVKQERAAEDSVLQETTKATVDEPPPSPNVARHDSTHSRITAHLARRTGYQCIASLA